MKKVYRDWLDKRTVKGRDGKANQVANEFRQRFKLEPEEAHAIYSEYIAEKRGL